MLVNDSIGSAFRTAIFSGNMAEGLPSLSVVKGEHEANAHALSPKIPCLYLRIEHTP